VCRRLLRQATRPFPYFAHPNIPLRCFSALNELIQGGSRNVRQQHTGCTLDVPAFRYPQDAQTAFGISPDFTYADLEINRQLRHRSLHFLIATRCQLSEKLVVVHVPRNQQSRIPPRKRSVYEFRRGWLYLNLRDDGEENAGCYGFGGPELKSADVIRRLS
jgi:hypothetical protein